MTKLGRQYSDRHDRMLKFCKELGYDNVAEAANDMGGARSLTKKFLEHGLSG